MNCDSHLVAVAPYGSIQDLPAGMPDGIKEIVPALHRRPIHREHQIPTLQSRTARRHPLFHRTHKRWDRQISERTPTTLYFSSLYTHTSHPPLPAYTATANNTPP